MASPSAYLVDKPSCTSWIAARKSLKVGWYRPYSARRFINFHGLSMRFRFGEYEGRNSSESPSSLVTSRPRAESSRKAVRRKFRFNQETGWEVDSSIKVTILHLRRKSRRLVGILSRSCSH